MEYTLENEYLKLTVSSKGTSMSPAWSLAS